MTDSPPPAEPCEADPFAFDPAPCASNRHDGWTPDRQRRFITALSVLGNVSRAARAVGISTAAAYKLRKREGAESFADAWDAALQAGRDRAFDIAMDRAINGITTPRYYRGKLVGMRHHFDHRTIMSALMPRPVTGGARGRR